MRWMRWHVWLGWLTVVPLFLWTLSGLVMVIRPIEDVRGTTLRTDPMPLPAASFRPPAALPTGTERLELVMRPDRAVWTAHGAEGARHAYDGATGAALPPIDAALARRVAAATLRAPAPVASTQYYAAEANPLDLRAGRPAWRVEGADGTRVYVDADTGGVLAVRTRFWRLFDLAWGLHILDPAGREDTSHPLLIGAAALSLIGVVIGAVLLVRRQWRASRSRRRVRPAR